MRIVRLQSNAKYTGLHKCHIGCKYDFLGGKYHPYNVRISHKLNHKLGTYLHVKWEYLNKMGLIIGKFQVLAQFFWKWSHSRHDQNLKV